MMSGRMLSFIKKIHKDIYVYRDGYFNSLGFIKNTNENQRLLVFLNNKEYMKEYYENKNIACIICSPDLLELIKDFKNIGICVVDDPKLLFFRVHNYLTKNTDFYGKKFKNQIANRAQIHPTAQIADYNVIIKDHVIIEPNVTILSNVSIGENTIIGAGTVVGVEGFQFIRTQNDILSVQHAGRVMIHQDVKVKANCCICKGIFKDATEIKEKTKIENLVHIAHGVKIGKGCFLNQNAMIAGYTYIGDGARIEASATVTNDICIGEQSHIKTGAVVTQNIGSKKMVSGNFAIEHNKFFSFLKSIQ